MGEEIIMEDGLTCCTGHTSHSGGHQSSDTQHMWCTAHRPPQEPEPPKPEGWQGGLAKKNTGELFKKLKNWTFWFQQQPSWVYNTVKPSLYLVLKMRSVSGYVVWIRILPFFFFFFAPGTFNVLLFSSPRLDIWFPEQNLHVSNLSWQQVSPRLPPELCELLS